uniref:Uncharacterized protein n=1 Tax=Glossina pallidipes TaxID=7398 RepID=A0A1A9ZUJ4_GLOPL
MRLNAKFSGIIEKNSLPSRVAPKRIRFRRHEANDRQADIATLVKGFSTESADHEPNDIQVDVATFVGKLKLFVETACEHLHDRRLQFQHQLDFYIHRKYRNCSDDVDDKHRLNGPLLPLLSFVRVVVLALDNHDD